MLRRYDHLPSLIKIAYVLDLQFQGQRLTWNRLAIATISWRVLNEGELPFANIRQWVFANSLILSEMQHIALSPIAFVGVFPYLCMYEPICECVCARLFERLIVGLHEIYFR